MKILLLSSLLLVAAYGSPVQKSELQEIIDTVNSSGAKWKAGHNFGENTTIASLRGLLGVKRNKLLKLPLRENHPIHDSSIPESFDARTHWPQCKSITHIRDQGNCGSCWAVSAAGTFTDRLCIATNGKFTLPLSSEELMSCCEECGDGCNGGFPEDAWNYFARNGLVTGGDYNSGEGCQPYEIASCSHHVKGPLPPCVDPMSKTPRCQRKCTNPKYSTPFSSDHHKVKRAYSVRRSVQEIQKEIMTHGPVQVTFTVYDDFLTYKSGVYHHVTGGFAGEHAVKAIGWGVEDGTPYWLVANQWNESWGDKGLFKILRGKNTCGIEADVVAGIPKV